MKLIVVPLDGSALAEQALGFAATVARAARAKVRLVLVHHPGAVQSGDVVAAELKLRRVEREYLDRVVQRLRADGLSDVKSVILTGDPEGELTRYAEERDPSLVVLASHGRGGLGRAWFGSVADHLIRTLAVPVVVVHAREDASPAPPVERIVVALDGSKAAEVVLDTAAKLARLLQAELVLRRVVEPVPLPADPLLPVTVAHDVELTANLERQASDYLAGLMRRLTASGARARAKALVGHGIARTLIDAAADERAGLIALATRARGGVRRLGLGSVADKVARGAPCPVLLLRRGRERQR
jgi:nucleotide-binding universal stress UspA family protein